MRACVSHGCVPGCIPTLLAAGPTPTRGGEPSQVSAPHNAPATRRRLARALRRARAWSLLPLFHLLRRSQATHKANFVTHPDVPHHLRRGNRRVWLKVDTDHL